MGKVKVEVCAGSLKDCLIAEKAGADQIELNSALFMGGLTPSLATLIEARRLVSIPIYPMLRTRGGGFTYDEYDIMVLKHDAQLFAENGANGLVFGFLNEDNTINKEYTKEFVDLCKSFNIDAIFHRAYDQTPNAYEAMEDLIELGVTRVLTSGHKPNASDAIDLLKELQYMHGDKIEILVGSGVNETNVKEIVERTGVKQVHSSFKMWSIDKSTSGKDVSYAYSNEGSYDHVSEDKIKSMIEILK